MRRYLNAKTADPQWGRRGSLSILPEYGTSALILGRSTADLFKGSFDEVFALIPDFVDGTHGLNDACGGTCESELTVLYLALVEGKSSVAEDDEPAVGEFAGIIFVEIENDFFFDEFVITDFHMDFSVLNPAT